MGATTQFVLDNIISILGGTGVIITSLSVYLGKLLADRSLMREKAGLVKDLHSQKEKHSLEMKILERDLQLELSKKDQFHQISKSTYENLFNKKISIYSDLLKLKTDYDRFINESGHLDYINPAMDIHSHFNLFKEKIEDNRLYISNELSTAFDEWYKEAAPFFQQLEEEDTNYHVNRSQLGESNVNPHQAWERQESIINKLVSKTSEKMNHVINQIEQDAAEIRTYMALKNT